PYGAERWAIVQVGRQVAQEPVRAPEGGDDPVQGRSGSDRVAGLRRSPRELEEAGGEAGVVLEEAVAGRPVRVEAVGDAAGRVERPRQECVGGPPRRGERLGVVDKSGGPGE